MITKSLQCFSYPDLTFESLRSCFFLLYRRYARCVSNSGLMAFVWWYYAQCIEYLYLVLAEIQMLLNFNTAPPNEYWLPHWKGPVIPKSLCRRLCFALHCYGYIYIYISISTPIFSDRVSPLYLYGAGANGASTETVLVQCFVMH